MNSVPQHILKRVYFLFAFFLVFGLAIFIRVMAIQFNRAHWAQKEIEEKVFFKKVVADRGSILSSDGTLMAVSLPYFRLAMDVTILDTTQIPGFRDSLMALSILLAERFDPAKDTLQYFNRISKAIAEKDRHIYLTRQEVPFQDLEEISKWPILNLGRYKGGFIPEKIHNKRFYPFGELGQITLGRLMDDTVGVRGLEHTWNEQLRGRDGYVLAQKTVGDSYIPLDKFGDETSTDGYDLLTTIDVVYQDIVYRALKEGVEKNSAKYGTAILLETETGAIKALANYPENFNYGMATLIEPGSTFKIAAAMALLEDGFVDLCDTVDTGNGKIKYEDREITDVHPMGAIPFITVIAQSSNVGVSKMVYDTYKDNPGQFISHIDRFGFNAPMLKQLSGEPAPVIIRPDNAFWNSTTLPSMSIGYTIQVTPLQMAAFYNAIANKGNLLRPWLVKEVSENSRPISTYGPESINERICSPATASRLVEMMEAVAEYGTAKDVFRKTPFRVAGKTGTARKTVNGQYQNLHSASFGGFFPAEKPRYTLFIVVDEPAGNIYGGSVSAPIFKRIAEEIYVRDPALGKPAEDVHRNPPSLPAGGMVYTPSARTVYGKLGITTSTLPESNWVRTQSNGHQVNLKPMDDPEKAIPNLRGMTARDAMYLLENMGLIVDLKGNGRVRQQSLRPGHRARPNQKIVLYLG
jgi:cell division protein FtsI (penicillin-binding protein 3)